MFWTCFSPRVECSNHFEFLPAETPDESAFHESLGPNFQRIGTPERQLAPLLVLQPATEFPRVALRFFEEARLPKFGCG